MNDHPTLEEVSAAVREHIADDYTRPAALGLAHSLDRASTLVELLAQLAKAAAIESMPEDTPPTDADGLRQNVAAYKRQIERYRHRFEQLAQAVLGDAYDLNATSAQILPQALDAVERLRESAECDHDGVPPGEWCLACHKPKPTLDERITSRPPPAVAAGRDPSPGAPVPLPASLPTVQGPRRRGRRILPRLRPAAGHAHAVDAGLCPRGRRVARGHGPTPKPGSVRRHCRGGRVGRARTVGAHRGERASGPTWRAPERRLDGSRGVFYDFTCALARVWQN